MSEKPSDVPTKAHLPALERRPLLALGAQHWQCPFCENVNGLPEITVCRCGAELGNGEATGSKPVKLLAE